jgi:glyoxylase-like metal-dependent hydrolase (beta-lactamase superfamily II)
MNIATITGGAFATNCYLVWPEPSSSALLVDCAGEADDILDRARSAGLTISLIATTHGHIDHVEALAELKQRTGAKVAVHELDAAMLADPMVSGAALFGLSQQGVTADVLLHEGEAVEVPGSGVMLTVLHTPGHTPGSICLLGDGVLFSGDCLFAGGIGRVDLPGGDEQAMLGSLARLAELDPGLAVYPGHGASTTIQKEREHNPWLSGW